MNFYKDVNDCVENYVNRLLNKYLSGRFQSKRNNLTSNDLDLLISDGINSTKLDVQYSFDFNIYGDIRIDLMSAGIRKDQYRHLTVKELNSQISKSKNTYDFLKSLYHIKKHGKYFTDPNMLGVFYLFYNETKPKNLDVPTIKKCKISSMLFLPSEILYQELKENNNGIIKINDKSKHNLIESHDSAFWCINANYICEKYNIPIFTSSSELRNLDIIFQQYFDKKCNLPNSFTI